MISLRDIAARLLTPGSKTAVHDCLRRLQYSKPLPRSVPMLSETNRLKRIEWAKRNIGKSWNQAVFADEASFWLFGGTVRMWAKKSEFRIVPTVKHSQKVHIWAGFSAMGTFQLCMFEQNMNGDFFVKILEWHLLTQAQVFYGDQWFLVQDNDPKHTCKKAKGWIAKICPKIQ